MGFSFCEALASKRGCSASLRTLDLDLGRTICTERKPVSCTSYCIRPKAGRIVMKEPPRHLSYLLVNYRARDRDACPCEGPGMQSWSCCQSSLNRLCSGLVKFTPSFDSSKKIERNWKGLGAQGLPRQGVTRGPRASLQNPEEQKPHLNRENDGMDQDSSTEVVDKDGYVIKVSKELMGVFRYVEKVKRSKIHELAHTLRQVAGACLFLTCVRGILGPLVEVFKTTPPTWSKLVLMLVSFDSFAICYLAMKAWRQKISQTSWEG